MTLTDRPYWDDHWQGIPIPSRIRRGSSYLADQILGFIDKYGEPEEGSSVLEIGGAPGQYLSDFSITHGSKITALDYSSIGCEATRKNMLALGLECDVVEADIWSVDDSSELAKFDLVYSLGFIEHFDDVRGVVAQHLKLLRPEGVLVIGVPNFRGIYRHWMSRRCPDHLSKHNLAAMDSREWEAWSSSLGLEVIEMRYLGGIEFGHFAHNESTGSVSKALTFPPRVASKLLRRGPDLLRKWNSPRTSSYLIGAFKAPSS